MNLLESHIKVKREKSGMTQLELAKKFHLTSPQFVSNWERGLAPIPPKMFPKLAKILGTTTKKLVELRVEDERSRLNKLMKRLGDK